MLGFFSFTEITDPSGHRAYNEWHHFDHLPEQFSVDGIIFGQRWVCTPWCRKARVVVSPLLERCHYMTLYLMRDEGSLPAFFELATRLREADRFFEARTAHLSGPFDVRGQWAAPRVLVSPAVVPHRPSGGVFVMVGPPVEGAALVELPGVAGVWSFGEDATDRVITVAFIDGDLPATSGHLGAWCQGLQSGLESAFEWAGPLERVEPNHYGWFDRLAPQ